MFINPISSVNTNKKTTFGNLAKNTIKNELPKNQLRVLLTQDIWAPRLKIKKPENAIEKEVLLEVLKQRLKLDRFTRLSNEMFETKGDIIILNELLENEPDSKKILPIRDKLNKKGNLASYFETLKKQIKLEQIKNQEALDYFNNIAQMEENFLNNKTLRIGKLEKFAIQIEKNNINSDGKYNTKELIEMVENDSYPNEKVTETITKSGILSKKQLLSSIESFYENYLRENVNIYSGHYYHYLDSKQGRREAEKTFQESLKKYPELKKQILKIYEDVEKKYIHKVNRIADMDIYPIGQIWDDMLKVENEIKAILREIKNLETQLANSPDNQGLKNTLKTKKEEITDLKNEWINGMKYSVKYENINHGRMAKAGNEPEYSYLVGKNKTLLKHVRAFQVYHNNNGSIPEEYWEEFLS